MVTAKFKVESIERSQYGYGGDKTEMQTIKMSPVYGGSYNGSKPSPENEKFWNATPSGNITLGTVNAEAGNAFTLGAEYYVTFEEAPE